MEKSVETVDNNEIKKERPEQLQNLKNKLAHQLLSLEQIKPPDGVSTGVDVFDNFLLWKGFPKGDLTLLSGKPGTGATSLWVQSASQVHRQNKWVAWINSSWELMPSYLMQKQIDLKKLLVVKKPEEQKKLFWILQELITSSLFEMIGCHLTETLLKNHQLQKLKKLARAFNVSLVFVSQAIQKSQQSFFSLVIECRRDFFTVLRALHRPTPFTISGSMIYADLMPRLTKFTGALLC